MIAQTHRLKCAVFDRRHVSAPYHVSGFALFSFWLVFPPTTADVLVNKSSRSNPLPPVGDAVDDLDVFVAGEAEVHEPLAVEPPRCLLQKPNPPPVALDQVVVGGEGLANAGLSFERWNRDQQSFEITNFSVLYSRAQAHRAYAPLYFGTLKNVCEEETVKFLGIGAIMEKTLS